MNELAIILLNWNGHDDTIECIKSIRNMEDQLYTIFVLDNGSKIESVETIEEWLIQNYEHTFKIFDSNSFNEKNEFNDSRLFFVRGKNNLGFAKGNNLIWDKIKNSYDYVLLLNNDTVIEDKAISKMVTYMNSNKNIGVLSCDIRTYSDKKKLWKSRNIS